jgi:hypothetical protein
MATKPQRRVDFLGPLTHLPSMNAFGLWVALAALLGVASKSSADPLDHWTKRSDTHVNRVRYCGGQFVGVGPGGTIVTSSNGIAWTPRASGTDRALWGVTYGAGSFVAVGDGVILTSPNAVSWTVSALVGARLRDIASSGATFVAVASPLWPTENQVNQSHPWDPEERDPYALTFHFAGALISRR